MGVNMEAESSMVGGQQKTVIPLFRSLLPLPMSEHIFLLMISIVPAVLVSQYGNYPGFDEVILVVIATIYLSLRIHLSQRRYKKAPTMEISEQELVLPYSHSSSGLERVVPADSVKHIEFFKGVGRLRNTDTSMVLTDVNDRTFRISGISINLMRVREVLEKYGWEYTRRRNPKQFAHWALLAVGAAVAVYVYIQMI